MNIIRSQILKRLPSTQETYGYVTKAIRQELELEKTHANDAFVSERSGEAKWPFIAGGRKQKRLTPVSMFASLTDDWRFVRGAVSAGRGIASLASIRLHGLTELLLQTKK